MARMIELLASEVSKLRVEQHSREAGVPSAFSFPNQNPYKEAQEQLQSLQKSKDVNED